METLSHIFSYLERQPRWRQQSQFRRIVNLWPTIVGPVVARQSEPFRLSKGILQVAVVSPAWAQTLTLERLRILEKINPQLSLPLQDIRFSPGDWWKRPRTNLAERPDYNVELQAHPCYCPIERHVPQEPAKSALEAFNHWARRQRQLADQQSLCPSCNCPCPPGEIQRWSVCSVCAAKQMESRRR